MLHSAERPFRPTMPPVMSDIKLREYGNMLLYPIDVVTVDRFPRRAAHAKLQQSVKPAATSLGEAHSNDDRLKRIMREVGYLFRTAKLPLTIFLQIKALVADPHPQIDVYVNDRDISFLKIIIEASSCRLFAQLGCVEAYRRRQRTSTNVHTKAGASSSHVISLKAIPVILRRLDLSPSSCIRMYVSFGLLDISSSVSDPCSEGVQARKGRPLEWLLFEIFDFLTPDGSSQVCVAELGRLWSSDITLKETFSLIYGLLLEPDLENPLEMQASLKYCTFSCFTGSHWLT